MSPEVKMGLQGHSVACSVESKCPPIGRLSAPLIGRPLQTNLIGCRGAPLIDLLRGLLIGCFQLSSQLILMNLRVAAATATVAVRSAQALHWLARARTRAVASSLSPCVKRLGQGLRGGAILEPPTPRRVVLYEKTKRKRSQRGRFQKLVQQFRKLFYTSTTPVGDKPPLLLLPLVASEAAAPTSSPLEIGATAGCGEVAVCDGTSEDIDND